jgi:hypothetical protein
MDTRRTKIEQLDFWWFDGIMSMLIVRVLDLKKKIVWNKDFREWGRVQVLNLAICARPEYDLPIFCTDFVSTASRNIIVLDLNPLYNIEQNPEYKDKYFLELLPMANKYAQVRNSFQECGSAQVARKDALATKLVCLLIYLFTPNF